MATKFNHLEEGQYFTWKEQTYRKLPQGKALCLATDRILDFGFNNPCDPCDRPQPRTGIILQYLHWALIQAHLDDEDRSEKLGLGRCWKVHLTLDLKTKTCFTRTE